MMMPAGGFLRLVCANATSVGPMCERFYQMIAHILGPIVRCKGFLEGASCKGGERGRVGFDADAHLNRLRIQLEHRSTVSTRRAGVVLAGSTVGLWDDGIAEWRSR